MSTLADPTPADFVMLALPPFPFAYSLSVTPNPYFLRLCRGALWRATTAEPIGVVGGLFVELSTWNGVDSSPSFPPIFWQSLNWREEIRGSCEATAVT